jgi:hypothetical protein
MEQLMLRHCMLVAFGAYVNPNKVKSIRKNMQFLQAEWQILRLADLQLTLHVDEGNVQRLGPAEDVVYDDIGVCVLVN